MSAHKNFKLTPEQEAYDREHRKLEIRVIIVGMPIIALAFIFDAFAGVVATALFIVNLLQLPYHIQRCRNDGRTWWKTSSVFVLLGNAIVIVPAIALAYHYHLSMEAATYNAARLETVVTYKLAASCDETNCPKESTASNMAWSYTYVTKVNGQPCTRIRVRGVWHPCQGGYENTSKDEWDRLQVGQVLKRVELK